MWFGMQWQTICTSLHTDNLTNTTQYLRAGCSSWRPNQQCQSTEDTHTFNGPFSGTTRVSRYQKGKLIWILLKQETVSGSGISWAICKSAPRSRQITMPAPHHSVFYRPDALPAAQPTASKHWRENFFSKHNREINNKYLLTKQLSIDWNGMRIC